MSGQTIEIFDATAGQHTTIGCLEAGEFFSIDGNLFLYLGPIEPVIAGELINAMRIGTPYFSNWADDEPVCRASLDVHIRNDDSQGKDR